MARIFYQEKQQLSRAWLWILLLDALVCGGIIVAVTKGNIEPTLIGVLIGLVCLFGVIAWILAASRLETEIDEHGLRYRYPVFYPRWHMVDKKDIRSISIENYDAIFQYGGWGHKRSRKHGTVAIIQGDIALRIEMTTGYRYTIGTQNKEGIRHAMDRMMAPTLYA